MNAETCTTYAVAPSWENSEYSLPKKGVAPGNSVSHTCPMSSFILETLIVGGATVLTAAASLILQTGASVKDQIELQIFLLPLIGAVFVSGGFVMLNPNPETRRITIGRGIFALFFGVLVPQLVGIVYPSAAELAAKPVVLVLVGGIVAGLAFVLSRPFTRGMYERADRVAKTQLDKLEQKHFPGVEPEITKKDNHL